MNDTEAQVRIWLEAYAAMMMEHLPPAAPGNNPTYRGDMLERIIDVRVYLRDTAASNSK